MGEFGGLKIMTKRAGGRRMEEGEGINRMGLFVYICFNVLID